LLASKAQEYGADAVKFQTFWKLKPELERYELTKEQWLELKHFCDYIGIMFLTTPHTYNSLEFVNSIVSIHKVASQFIKSYPFLQIINSFNKPIILSTGNFNRESGMATNTEINNAIHLLNNKRVTLMHCVSKYPCEDGKYKRIKQLQNQFRLPIGLSDHTKNIELPRGLPIYEKHFMLKGKKCIDENVSLNEYEFKKMVDYLG